MGFPQYFSAEFKFTFKILSLHSDKNNIFKTQTEAVLFCCISAEFHTFRKVSVLAGIMSSEM